MARVFERGGKLYIEYAVDGKRKRKSTGLPDTKENRRIATDTIVPKLEVMIATGEIHRKAPKTFGHYFNEFLKIKSKNRSYHSKAPHWRKLNECFKDIEIDRITRLDIKTYLHAMDIKSVSKNTYKSALSEIFEMAIDDNVIDVNPAANIRLKPDQKKRIEYFTKDEVNTLIEQSTGVLRAYLMVAFHTGMRPEEILGMQWGDISDDGRISIKRVRTRGRTEIPKTASSVRTIPCPAFVVDELKSIYSGSFFIFGDISDSTYFIDRWQRLLKKCGLKRRRMYCTRHTFATIMSQDRVVSINELAGLLGHSSPRITFSHYASVIDAKSIEFDQNFDLFGTNLAHKKRESPANSHDKGLTWTIGTT